MEALGVILESLGTITSLYRESSHEGRFANVNAYVCHIIIFCQELHLLHLRRKLGVSLAATTNYPVFRCKSMGTERH